MNVKVIPKKTVTLIEPAKKLMTDKDKYRQKRVAAYCRVSTGSEEQLTSYKTQMKVYTEMIAENTDWEFAGLYADEGISGTRADKRPQFTKMIRDCMNGKIDLIITKSVSRFARNTVECLDFVRMLKARGMLNGCENVLIHINSEARKILIVPTSSSDKDAVRWVKKSHPREGRKISCKKLTDSMFDIWKWDREYIYRTVGRLVTSGNKVMLLFDFSEPECWKRPEAKSV